MSDNYENYPSNSNKSKRKAAEEKKEIVPVAKGTVHKKTLGDKVADAVFSEDAKTVKDYAIWDVIVPTIKNGIADLIIGGVQMMLFGDTGGRRSSGGSYSSRRNGGHENYSGYYTTTSSDRSKRQERVRNGRYSYPIPELPDRASAEKVLDGMAETIEDYGEASVADLLEMCDMQSTFVDHNWGWRDARDITCRRTPRGYIIDCAEPIYLD